MGLLLACLTFLSRNSYGLGSSIALPLLLRACLKVSVWPVETPQILTCVSSHNTSLPATLRVFPVKCPMFQMGGHMVISSSWLFFSNPPLCCSSSPQGLPRSAQLQPMWFCNYSSLWVHRKPGQSPLTLHPCSSWAPPCLSCFREGWVPFYSGCWVGYHVPHILYNPEYPFPRCSGRKLSTGFFGAQRMGLEGKNQAQLQQVTELEFKHAAAWSILLFEADS